MSETKTLFTVVLLILLGSMAAAQAQVFTRYEVLSSPADNVREGGQAEEAGDVYIIADILGPIDNASITLYYSAPLNEDLVATDVMVMGGDMVAIIVEDDDNNDGNGTITFLASAANIIVQNVLLDVSKASAPIMVQVEVVPDAANLLIANGPTTRTVIEAITLGVTATATAATARTRGTDAAGVMGTLTIGPGFRGAFMDGSRLKIEFDGIPAGATLMVTAPDVGTYGKEEVPVVVEDSPLVTGAETLKGEAGETETATLVLGDTTSSRVAPSKKFNVMLTLTSSSPMTLDEISARVTFTDTDTDTDDFADAYTPYVDVFNIRPAQCELLFPVVSVLPDFGNWDTAISITNPGYTAETVSGGLTFTFYDLTSMDSLDMDMDIRPMYDTTDMLIGLTGVGLDEDGTLRPGGTYQVMTSEILEATGWGTTFRGHVHVRADYTNCSGLGWVTDFMTVNQAYTATVIDNDTGVEPLN